MRSWPIAIHVGSWVLGAVGFGLLAVTGIDGMSWICFGAGVAAFFSGLAALPVALIRLFESRQAPVLVRLQYAGVAFMAAVVLVVVISFQLMTAGRH
jgi:hypothetical protein